MTRFVLLLSLTALAAACSRPADQPSAAATPAPTHETASFLRFGRVAQIAAPDLANVSGTVEVDDQQTARLNALVAGHVAALLVQVGDHVDAGQPLVAIDSPDVKTAQADEVRAESDLAVARRGAERADRLHEARAIADKDYFQAREDLRKATADFDRAKAQLERLGVTAGQPGTRYLVRAPFTGTVLERKAIVGMEASPDGADPLVVISDLSRVRVVLRLPERQLPRVGLGETVSVRVDAYPEDFPGTVVAIGDVIDDATRTVPVRCTVPNPNHLLKPAMFARVTLKANAGSTMVAVPSDALLSDGQKFRVVVRRPDGQLEVRPVDVGAELGGQVEVVGGVKVGEEVVTEGALFAAQGLSS
jgi:cobalt-zinc-cadmium efflux system membrane fusion protein